MDTIADMLTTILNAQRVGKKHVAIPYSGFKENLLRFLQEKGMIAKLRTDDAKRKILVTLSYDEENVPAIQGMKRLSKSGKKHYAPSTSLPYTYSGIGFVIVSTSKGLMDERQARKAKIGGELVCAVW